MIHPLLEVRHLVTLHAACLMFAGKGILLAGIRAPENRPWHDACARRGWTYVSDDASAFVRNSIRPSVIGHPQKFRFREPVGELFPEFRGLKSTVRTYGKPTIEVRDELAGANPDSGKKSNRLHRFSEPRGLRIGTRATASSRAVGRMGSAAYLHMGHPITCF